MTITVDFTGTPLSGTEPLSVAFTSDVVITAAATQGGGTSNKKLYYGKIPEYYSRRSVKGFERVQLPQDPVANPVAVEVVRELANINERLDRGARRFSVMLTECERLARLTAEYIEMAQITDLLQQTQIRLQAAQDAASAANDAQELEELRAMGLV